MSPNDPTPEATAESLRPSSVWTNDSTFADSAIAISMDGTITPKQFDDDELELRSPSEPRHTLSERLTQLAAVAWAAEQDEYVDENTRAKILRALATIENVLDGREEVMEPNEEDRNIERQASEAQSVEDTAQLEQVRQHLSTTISEMRLRQQEQRHLYELTLQRLDDVAGTCASQKKRIQDLEAEVELLDVENRKLERDNEGFQSHAEQLTVELQQKDIALQAMSSAVAGLDGWISDSLTPQRLSTRRMRATRGRGRFQTHYYVDVPVEGTKREDAADTLDGREVRDGLTAWVRGFRDVEEATAGFHSPSKPTDRFAVQPDPATMTSCTTRDEDDWGDFQAPSSRNYAS